MNKKLTILTSILALTVAMPSFADISANESNPSCVEDTLDTASGTSNLTAEWDANTINLAWYSDGQQVTPQNNAANTCTYDSTLSIPSNTLTKTGYTFGGWKIRSIQQYVLSSLNIDMGENSPIFASYGLNGTYCEGSSGGEWNDDEGDYDYEWYGVDEGGSCSDAEFSGLSAGEWTVTFSYGTVDGIAKCSSTNGTWATAGTPSDTNGQYCWCQATNYTPLNGTKGSVASPAWVFNLVNGSADNCATVCANNCASRVRNGSDFRSAVFGAGSGI